MKIANFLIAGAAALILTSCGGAMSFEEAKKINEVESHDKLTSEQKELIIKNSIEQTNAIEFNTDFEDNFIADQITYLEQAEEWAKEDSNLKDLVDEFKEAEQAYKERKKEYLREKIEWAKDNGLEKIAESAENTLKNL